MATRIQAKTAIDSVVTLVKADIDLLPSTVNILRGTISFQPNGWILELSVANITDGNTLRDSIVASLNSLSRVNSTSYNFNPITRSDTWPPGSEVVKEILIISGSSRFRITFA